MINKILIAGGSGFIGSSLQKALHQRGIETLLLSRSPGPNKITWEELHQSGLPPCDAVINLSGANVMAKAWTPNYKRELMTSRIDTTKALVKAIIHSKNPPQTFINASAVAWYPPHKTLEYTEDSPSVSDFQSPFLTDLVHQWEAAALLPKDSPVRQVIIRIGVVLDKKEGAIAKMLLPFKLGLGGVLGSGDHPFPWIHITDLIGIFIHALDNHSVRGVLNGVAPHCVTNRELTRALGRALHRPTFFSVPAFVLRLALGERANFLLEGQKVVPQRTVEAGYSYRFPRIEEALASLLS